ncbi:hypothetical protein JCM10213_005898 [Rhodosporidiobolus nylandii]
MSTLQTDLVLHPRLPFSWGSHISLYRGTYHNHPAVVKQCRDDEGGSRLRREARFYRAVDSRLDGQFQRALEVVVDEDEEIQSLVLEELAERDGWELLNYFSRLSREETENLYFLLANFHSISRYTHGRFEPDRVFYRPSTTAGEGGSFRLFNFSFAESRHECPGPGCGELVSARRSLGIEEHVKPVRPPRQYEGWELEYVRKRAEAWKQHLERARAEELRSGRPPVYRAYDGPLDLTRRA